MNALADNRAMHDRAASLIDSDPPTDWTAFAVDHGIEPAFLLLAKSLTRPSSNGLSRLLRALPPGADTCRAVHRWVAWGWSDAREPLREGLSDAHRAAGDMIANLHLRVAEGSPPDRAAWRAARVALSRMEPDPQVDAIAAAAWDFVSSPGAAEDMLNGWMIAIDHHIASATGWTSADTVLLQAEARASSERAQRRVGQRVETDTWKAAFVAAMTEERLPDRTGIFARHDARQAMTKSAIENLFEDCRLHLHVLA